MPRFSHLQPPAVEWQERMAILALQFFHPLRYKEMCAVIGDAADATSIRPLTGLQFLRFLRAAGVLAEPYAHAHQLRELVLQLVRADLLTIAGGGGADALMNGRFFFTRELTEREQQGHLWLAPALGPQFLHHTYADTVVQITGVDALGDVHAGTGLVIAPGWILTCAHVLRDMTVDTAQRFGGVACTVLQTLAHPELDVGLIEVDGVGQEVSPLAGLAFREPALLDTVYTLGYPPVPQSREPVLVMQRGEVSAAAMTDFGGHHLFLYSAIARPGNSGGPILAGSGHIVGIVTQELLAQRAEGQAPVAPFYAGVPTRELARAVAELEPSLDLPVETYD